MNNRLGDLGIDGDTPAWATDDGDDAYQRMESGENSQADPFIDDEDEAGDESGKPQPKYMDGFFRDVDAIKLDIEAIKKATRKIGEINEEAVLATTTDKENELSNQLRPVVNETNKQAKRTKNMLALLKEENSRLKDDNTINASDMRVRENLCNTLTRKFIDEMKLYQNAQQKYKSDIKKKVKRQVQIVKPDATDEEVEEVMRSDGGRDALYKEQILAGGVNDQIKTTYQNVASKYQDVLTLEQSVAELHQMFLDFALLTEQQGELLDQIEFQVRNAGDYIEEANVQVHEAIQYQKKVRKKQCWIIGIVVVLVVILLFSLKIIP